MNFFLDFKKLLVRGVNALAGKASQILHPLRKPKSPLADRLLTDALRLGEIPSPTVTEEQRGAFILERLNILGINPLIDDQGNIYFRLQAADLVNEPPLLIFAELGSSRWHPVESLSRLDAETAQGAGLADSLGPAALLSLAESMVSGRLRCRRDLFFLFVASAPDNPEERLFQSIVEDPLNRPFAAIGVQGLSLGSLVTRLWGNYRMKIQFSQDVGLEPSSLVVNSLLSTAQMLSRITWDTQETTRLYIHRIEAAASLGKTPAEGILEIEIDSSDGAQLDKALGLVQATVDQARVQGELRVATQVISAIPAGDPEVNRDLIKTIFTLMREQRIKIQEETGPDRSALVSIHGIPALSLGIALGREGRSRDIIEIASIEKGRALLETAITHLTRNNE